MNQQIDAIFDNGVLKPLVPLALPNNTRVTLTVDVTSESAQSNIVPQDEWEQLLLSVAHDCGVSLSDSAVSSEGLYE
jgi:predicted DNA-binding antitoxin AbrB/MazE fold protein